MQVSNGQTTNLDRAQIPGPSIASHLKKTHVSQVLVLRAILLEFFFEFFLFDYFEASGTAINDI